MTPKGQLSTPSRSEEVMVPVEVFHEGISSFFASFPPSDRKWRSEHFAKSGNSETDDGGEKQSQDLSLLLSIARDCRVVDLLRAPPKRVLSSLLLTAILHGKVWERERGR